MRFSRSGMHGLIKNQGDKRVSKPVSVELGKILERFAGDIAEEAIAIAEADGHRTVKQNHIKKALSG